MFRYTMVVFGERRRNREGGKQRMSRVVCCALRSLNEGHATSTRVWIRVGVDDEVIVRELAPDEPDPSLSTTSTSRTNGGGDGGGGEVVHFLPGVLLLATRTMRAERLIGDVVPPLIHDSRRRSLLFLSPNHHELHGTQFVLWNHDDDTDSTSRPSSRYYYTKVVFRVMVMRCCGGGDIDHDDERIDAIVRTVECPVCHELLRDPRRLPCGHNFCAECLARCVVHASTATCPVCRAPYETIGPADYVVRDVCAQIAAATNSNST